MLCPLGLYLNFKTWTALKISSLYIFSRSMLAMLKLYIRCKGLEWKSVVKAVFIEQNKFYSIWSKIQINLFRTLTSYYTFAVR